MGSLEEKRGLLRRVGKYETHSSLCTAKARWEVMGAIGLPPCRWLSSSYSCISREFWLFLPFFFFFYEAGTDLNDFCEQKCKWPTALFPNLQTVEDPSGSFVTCAS